VEDVSGRGLASIARVWSVMKVSDLNKIMIII